MHSVCAKHGSLGALVDWMIASSCDAPIGSSTGAGSGDGGEAAESFTFEGSCFTPWDADKAETAAGIPSGRARAPAMYAAVLRRRVEL